ncbi:hypothetical protein PML80_03515 [Aerococcus urinaeequi]|uniref:Uncharacterized protein n=1 Tax=Aerococcus urinaeequi TaxID=51665 RepID=A0AAF0BJM2_9LACT|nr:MULTISPECIES: hypothetical protein [Aerococcus]MCT1798465.1 hypothetical protein [Aerococcus viridans]WCG38402.1 hypothetical protein PML80_03515 [Aerococcus urinaeequi]
MNAVWVLLLGAILYGFNEAVKNSIGKIPDRIHDRTMSEFQNTLQKELSKFSIAEENLYLKKIEVYELFTSSFFRMIDSSRMQGKQKEKAMQEATKDFDKFMRTSFFYCDDETLRTIIIYRRFLQTEDMSDTANTDKTMAIMTDIFIAMRKSLGYKEEISREDILVLLLKDWEQVKNTERYSRILREDFSKYE